MCWAHEERAFDKRLKLIKNSKTEEKILGDNYHIQLSYSKDIFNLLISSFVDKWSQVNESAINVFLEYFRKEWVDSSNNGCYEGLCYLVPSTNNGLDGNNGSIKKCHTLRERVSFNKFLPNCITKCTIFTNGKTLVSR